MLHRCLVADSRTEFKVVPSHLLFRCVLVVFSFPFLSPALAPGGRLSGRKTHPTMTMDGKSSGHLSQPLGAQPSLSIRTAVPTTSQLGPPSSSSAPPNSAYPIPIPLSKLTKAVKLYTLYRYEEGLAQRHGPAHADPLLSPATAQSATSRSSRVYTPSASSAYDGFTDRSSLLSFTEEESGPSGQGNGTADLIAFNGKRVKHRVRKPLSPIAKAKAALIRCLGSCASCRSRRVPVSALAFCV